MLLLIPCVVFLALDKKSESSDSAAAYTAHEKRVYGGLAIICGLISPVFWLFKAYFLRKTIDAKLFTSTLDLVIDCQIAQGIFMTSLYVIFLAIGNEFVL